MAITIHSKQEKLKEKEKEPVDVDKSSQRPQNPPRPNRRIDYA